MVWSLKVWRLVVCAARQLLAIASYQQPIASLTQLSKRLEALLLSANLKQANEAGG